jgi:hypothetical protein
VEIKEGRGEIRQRRSKTGLELWRVEFREGGLKSEFEKRSQNFSNSPEILLKRQKYIHRAGN